MIRHLDSGRNWFSRLWQTNAALTATAVGMTVVLGLTMVGLWVDPRTIDSAPVWLKPAKFAVSLAVYSITLAWIFAWLEDWPRLTRTVGRITAAVFVIEMAVIALQAARGTTSHFNVSTPFDGVLFGVMGAGILLQTFASVAVAVALWRQTFGNRAMGWAFRIGMVITIVAAFSGGLMTQPTAAQLDQSRASGRLVTSGAHTVGALDGGPGLPGTGWSTTHGDLRVPHFLGLHAMQALPLLAIAIARGSRRRELQARLVVTAGLSYAALFGVLLSQALRGHSVVSLDGLTTALLCSWLVATASGFWLVTRPTTASTSVRSVSHVA
jgi:hypothetical protein